MGGQNVSSCNRETYKRHSTYDNVLNIRKICDSWWITQQVGDIVKIMEARPLLKTKRFRLVEIVEEAVII